MLMRVWAVMGVAGAVVVASGWLPAGAAREVALTRGGPVLGFLVAITVLAELADRAQVFDAAATGCARLARGSTARLFVLVAALGAVITVAMSLDTTAVLLTPVVLTVTGRLGLRPLPFALLAVWLANTTSLLLPVSNLTNLLALQHEHLTTAGFAARMALPEVVALVVTVAYLGLLFRKDLRGRYQPPRWEGPEDRWTFGVCALACLGVAPGVVAGVAPWAATAPCAAAALAVFLIRRRHGLDWALVPWRILILVEGLLLVVTAVARHGLTHLLADLAGGSVLRTAAVAAGASNAINNLPAYLAVEPVVPAGHTTQLLGALLGTNGGPLISLWGSLATLLWRERCRARGVAVGPLRFALVGLGGVPLVLLGTWAALLVTG